MSAFAEKTVILLTAICLGTWLDASAQLASTKLDGLQISVASIYRFGDSRNLDCSIGLKFTGEKADRAISISPVKIIQAVDDTGMDLVRTNKHSFPGDDWLPSRTSLWFWQTVGGLKAPAPEAKAIRHLEAEVVLFAPTANTPVLTNFMSRPGTVLHQVTLDQYQVKISYDRETNSLPPSGSLIIDNSSAAKTAGKTILLKVDDPQHKLVSLAFQKTGGGILATISKNQSVFGSHTEFTYGFLEVPPPDLNLVVYVASPEASDKVRFSLDNIRLPWVDTPDFEVTAEVSKGLQNHGTNPYACYLTLSFTGGPLTNALGIRKLWLTQATDDAGQEIKVGYNNWLTPDNWRFDALPPPMGDGRYVRKFVPLVFQSQNPKMIRILKGDAELICSSVTNGGLVVIGNFMNRVGASFDLPPLQKNRVKLAYLGPVNYATSRADFIKTNFVAEHGGWLPEELPANINNSLQFSLDDPDNVVFAPWGGEEINFLDDKGRELLADSVMTSGKFRVYRFKTLPPPGTQLRVYLAVPESLQRIPFKIENIPLN